jgi:hypothetical protein
MLNNKKLIKKSKYELILEHIAGCGTALRDSGFNELECQPVVYIFKEFLKNHFG